jgi:CHASE2 domain-containing sensor protein
MYYWRRFTLWLGALPASRVTWGLALVFCLWAVLDLFVLKVSSGLASTTYDAMVRARFYAAALDSRIVIVDIDEASLAQMAPEFGRWPWPRDTLATVLDFIEKQNPQAIAWDVLFSDADRLSPGGDKAFDAAAQRSVHSHFAVVRLPAEYDRQSQVTRATLPGLWVGKPDQFSTSPVALITPVLPAVAAGKLGYNNGYADADGVLRRYRLLEVLPDGGQIQSIALSLARSLDAASAFNLIADYVHATGTNSLFHAKNMDNLMVWRSRANSYPRIPFFDVFSMAEGGKVLHPVPSFAGKIVLIGATASSLHDMHPTPLSAQHTGVDSLATAIDNAVNQRRLAELPRWLQALLAIGLCIGMAWWVQKHGISSLDPALLLLPGALLGFSYLSLNGSPVFLDLQLAAGIALLFIAVLRVWNGWRRTYWCGEPEAGSAAMGVLALHLAHPAADVGLDALVRTLELRAPQCRVMGGDATATWPARLRWPELHHGVALAGPLAQLQTLRAALLSASPAAPKRAMLTGLGVRRCTEPTAVSAPITRSQWAQHARSACAALIDVPANL